MFTLRYRELFRYTCPLFYFTFIGVYLCKLRSSFLVDSFDNVKELRLKDYEDCSINFDYHACV